MHALTHIIAHKTHSHRRSQTYAREDVLCARISLSYYPICKRASLSYPYNMMFFGSRILPHINIFKPSETSERPTVYAANIHIYKRGINVYIRGARIINHPQVCRSLTLPLWCVRVKTCYKTCLVRCMLWVLCGAYVRHFYAPKGYIYFFIY